MSNSKKTSFDRRTFLKAGGVLAIGFSMAGLATEAGASVALRPASLSQRRRLIRGSRSAPIIA